MKKKIMVFALTAVLALGVSAMFASCSREPEHKTHYDVNADGDCDKCGEMMEGHKHILSLGWKVSDTQHWHTATCHPSEKVDLGDHQFQRNGFCTVCKIDPIDASPLPVADDDGNKWYYLQAEHAILDDGDVPSNRTMTVETGRNEFIVDPENAGQGHDGISVVDIGYFGGQADSTGQTITWKFNSDKAVSGVKIRFRAASGDVPGGWGGSKVNAVPLDEENSPTLTFNEVELDTTGKAAGYTYTFTEDEVGPTNQSGRNKMYCAFSEVEFTVDLKAGENVFVITSNELGLNPDALMIEAGKATITFQKTDNSSRPGSH